MLAAYFRKAWREYHFSDLTLSIYATQASAGVLPVLTDFKSVSMQKAHCATREVSLSPDGRYLAAWSTSGFPGKGFGMFTPDSAIIDMPCVMARGSWALVWWRLTRPGRRLDKSLGRRTLRRY